MIIYINGRGMNAPELKAYISELEAENAELRAKVESDDRQIAEWLTKLKEARRLLKWAVEGFRKLGTSLNDDGECDGDCLYCPINNHGNCLKWEYETEALALIGEEGDTE